MIKKTHKMSNTDLIKELIKRINYFIILQYVEINSLISPLPTDNLELLNFTHEEIIKVKSSNQNTQFDIMYEILNEKTMNNYNNVNHVIQYMNNNLKSQYKQILLYNVKTYEENKEYYSILSQ